MTRSQRKLSLVGYKTFSCWKDAGLIRLCYRVHIIMLCLSFFLFQMIISFSLSFSPHSFFLPFFLYLSFILSFSLSFFLCSSFLNSGQYICGRMLGDVDVHAEVCVLNLSTVIVSIMGSYYIYL